MDINFLRNEPERVKKGIAAKNADQGLVDRFLALDAEWRSITAELDGLRADQKKLSKERNREQGAKNKESIKKLEAAVRELEGKREDVWMHIPNLSSEDTPVGKDETGNLVIKKIGETNKFGFTPKDYMELGAVLDLIDTETAAKVSGARFGYLKNEAALLEFALIQFGLSILTDEKILRIVADGVQKGYSAKPFVPVVPPVMIRPDVMQKMARLEPKEERYHIASDDLYLAGSAEHTMGPMHMDESIKESDLPLRYAGFSTSFRREAGSYGKDTRGIFRVHQFDKLEMESFTSPENGITEQNFFVAIQEYLMQKLGLPYQVVICSTGDQGDPDFRHIDIETWMPGQNKYRETHSADYMTDYQARRLGTKIKRSAKDVKSEYAHMNDATVFAIGRTVIAIMENYQTKDGKVMIPEVLQKYVGKEIIDS
ncbi:MAG: serine--tRNA ligase [Candidatus Liptonbacteria bacterium]|nr:serine--tRNA ligase [Candidatus Liptonbacteria bacterium]